MPKKLTLADFIERSKNIFGESYDYTESEYVDTGTPVGMVCIKHNLKFSVKPINHLYPKKGYRSAGCPECGKESFVKNTTKSQDIFVAEAKLVHGDKYDYTKTKYEGKGKHVIITCPLHGDFPQEPTSHLQGRGCKKCASEKLSLMYRLDSDKFLSAIKQLNKNCDFTTSVYNGYKAPISFSCNIHGRVKTSSHRLLRGRGCPKCAQISGYEKCKNTTSDFIERSESVHNGLYTYRNAVYTGNKNFVVVTCGIHGDFKTNAGNHLSRNGGGCPKCSGKSSGHETKLKDFVGLPCKVGDRFILEGKEIDLLYGDLGVEVNGVYWHSTTCGKYQTYHLDKTIKAQTKNIKLLHFWDYEISEKLPIVGSMIKARLGLSKIIYARKTTVEPIDSSSYTKFIEEHHISGVANSSIRLGLVYEGRVVAVMGFSKARFDNANEWEIVRFCSLQNTTVVGGASKLFKYFTLHEKPESVVSYADRRFGEGEVYTKLGFVFSHSSKPNYFHFKAGKRYSRHTTQKHKLKSLIGEAFNPCLSEVENLKNNGYVQVFDCGNNVYVWKSLDNN